ncbi:hypothetical protein [Pleomorphomonas carboxyditropha]|uniref:Uncharacterized protein n=1 Tax=Pleomorphomonas carboxyditropha TaxID=2023338 RepID=A0A2G9WU99_9HYPH|nr:hypothetical protein [Pleomorphomonas carboxyditropha]PIO98278.1 hypothetical protein CJ014_16630 [Pleomorphomonas carboxyditropha]
MVEILDEPTEDGAIGLCYHYKPGDWLDTVRICLAGPVMDALKSRRPFYLNDAPGGGSDIDQAWQAYVSALAPRPPVALQEWLPAEAGADLTSLVDAYTIEGWRPEGLSGQLKRKMTLFCNKYEDALEFIHVLIGQETTSLIRFMNETPAFMTCVTVVADQLLEKSRLTSTEIYEACRLATA